MHCSACGASIQQCPPPNLLILVFVPVRSHLLPLLIQQLSCPPPPLPTSSHLLLLVLLLVQGASCCVSCGAQVLVSPLTWEVLPLVAFELEPGISEGEALALLGEDTGVGDEAGAR